MLWRQHPPPASSQRFPSRSFSWYLLKTIQKNPDDAFIETFNGSLRERDDCLSAPSYRGVEDRVQ
jgi:hypothetical protein